MDTRKIVTIILVFWALAATFTAAYFYSIILSMRPLTSSEVIYVDIGINYGNGTLVWINDTKVLNGSSVFQALLLVADEVNVTSGAYGIYVHGINGVNEYDSVAWLYAIYGREVPTWQKVDNWRYPSVSSDKLTLKNNDVIVWVFLNWEKYGSNLPLPTSTENLRG